MLDKMTQTPQAPPLLAALWKDFNFVPNDQQRAAILHSAGPLFLPAGPGSGKTRVLLWRAVNLIATHSISPNGYLSFHFHGEGRYPAKKRIENLVGRGYAEDR